MPSAHLPDRRLIRITGTDAQDFLQNLITTDIESLPEGEARAGALLTPQGKILFDFLIWRDTEGFLVETDVEQRDALVRRLTMYKLRAAVTLSAFEADGIDAAWGEDAADGGVTDDRFRRAGIVLKRIPGHTAEGTTDAYDSLRIKAGIAVSGADYALQDAFPHDVLMDVNGGVSFQKGCFVGQEVVSRMKHRGTARRRVVAVSAQKPLPATGTELMAGGKPIGALGTVLGHEGLAIVRTDRAADAMASGTEILAGDVAVTLTLPAWSGLTFPATGTAED